MRNLILLCVAVLILVVGGILIFSLSQPESANVVDTSTESEIPEQDQKDDNAQTDTQSTGSTPGQFLTTSELQPEVKNVYFFSAAWCPTCQAFNRHVSANMDNLPEGVAILKVDYDTETALKQKYGITYQHTFVQVDENGNQLKKWSGSLTLDSFSSQVI